MDNVLEPLGNPPLAAEAALQGAPIHSDDELGTYIGALPDDDVGAAVDIRKHYDDIHQTRRTTRTENEVSCVKNLHNWIKSVLIRTYAFPLCKVLDLGCGKGGDLLKWGKANVSKYVGLDISHQAIHDAIERYKGRSNDTIKPDTIQLRNEKFEADFMCHDFCDPLPDFKSQHDTRRKDQSSQHGFDLCSCQFALHYAFESEIRANTFFQNVASHLVDGGIFIATFPDDEVILKRLLATNQPNNEPASIGNQLYSLNFHTYANKETVLAEYNKKQFGLKYNFSLSSAIYDCPEYIVHKELLHRLCNQHNMHLIHIHPFQKILKEQKQKHKQLYNKMNVSSYIPPDEFAVSQLYCAAIFRKKYSY